MHVCTYVISSSDIGYCIAGKTTEKSRSAINHIVYYFAHLLLIQILIFCFYFSFIFVVFLSCFHTTCKHALFGAFLSRRSSYLYIYIYVYISSKLKGKGDFTSQFPRPLQSTGSSLSLIPPADVSDIDWGPIGTPPHGARTLPRVQSNPSPGRGGQRPRFVRPLSRRKR